MHARAHPWMADNTLAYGSDNRFVFTTQHFDTWGSTDASFFAGDSNGHVMELDYIPFTNSHAPVWPWANLKLGAQYT